MTYPLIGIGGLGPTELLLILLVVVLLFGAKKLPDLARGSGQALRIFKAETKELKGAEVPPEEKDIADLNEAEREHRAEPGA